MRVLLNAGLFQLTWFACVLGGAAGSPWWGVFPISGLVAMSLRNPYTRADLHALAILLVAGGALEYLWISSGILVYQDMLPVWILVLWAGVAFTINHSLGWFQQFPLCGGALAAVAAPLCYLSGEQLGAVTVPEPLRLIWISLAWGVLFSVVFRLPIMAARRRVSV